MSEGEVFRSSQVCSRNSRDFEVASVWLIMGESCRGTNINSSSKEGSSDREVEFHTISNKRVVEDCYNSVNRTWNTLDVNV